MRVQAVADGDEFGPAALARMRQRHAFDVPHPARARLHHHHTVSEVDGFFNVVRHHQHRDALLLPQAAQFLLQAQAGQRVERDQGFVQQQHVGPPGQRARHIHTQSGRRGPFIAVNCGAFSETLIDAELFGHESGAFTGANQARPGWFEAANGGTLFLDEIGDLPKGLQVKLLRVLQERQVVRLGSRKSIPLDVRLVAATNVDLQKAWPPTASAPTCTTG